MQTVIIDEEFKHLMPALDKDTFALLEENILENGCRDALVLWEGILIDGHNRYQICTKHNIPFKTVDKEFASREEVLIWIISTQMSRRNLSPMQLSYFRGLHYRADKKLVGRPDGDGLHNKLRQNDAIYRQQGTASRLGEQYKVSKKTIERDAKIATAVDNIGDADPEAKTKILAGEVKIDKRALAEAAFASREATAELARRIANGTYEKPCSEITDESNINYLSSANGSAADDSRHQGKMIISGLTGQLFHALHNAATNGSHAKLKNALRAYIILLEDMYRQL